VHVVYTTISNTGWRRPIWCLKLQVKLRKRATNYRALLRKMICKIRHPMGIRHPVLPPPICFWPFLRMHISVTTRKREQKKIRIHVYMHVQIYIELARDQRGEGVRNQQLTSNTKYALIYIRTYVLYIYIFTYKYIQLARDQPDTSGAQTWINQIMNTKYVRMYTRIYILYAWINIRRTCARSAWYIRALDVTNNEPSEQNTHVRTHVPHIIFS